MIVLLTDFGLEGPYIGQLQAVLQQQAPGVPLVQLFSDLPPFDIQAAAYLLPAYAQGFPPGSVFLCVVDPGVGSGRPGVVLAADGCWYVGPNEGLFALLARRAARLECRLLPEPPGAAATFHGRDVFAPAAARLARGVTLPAAPLDVAVLEQPDWPDELFRVVYVDRFGNALTGVRADTLDAGMRLQVNGHVLRSARTFADMAPGEAFWYANSNGLVEFAVNRGRACDVLRLEVGTPFALVV